MTPFPGASDPKPTFQELVPPVVSGQAFKFIRGPGAPRVPRAAARRALLLLLLLGAVAAAVAARAAAARRALLLAARARPPRPPACPQKKTLY